MATKKVETKKVEKVEKVKRVYGKRKTIGDIIHNAETGITFCRIQSGFFGYHTINLVKQSDGSFLIEKQYFQDGEYKTVKIGKTFPAKDKDGNDVEGITQAALGLGTMWDKDLNKNITDITDALFITTHLLKTPEKINDNLTKIGWVDGQFGIEA